MVRLVKGDLGHPHAVWAALNTDFYYLTTEPYLTASLTPTDLVHTPPADGA